MHLSASTVVIDLEGTTSAAGFILGDLYDYVRPRLAAWRTGLGSDAGIIDGASVEAFRASTPHHALADALG